MSQDSIKKTFKDTLNLPHTDFPIRAQYQQEDAAMLERWNQENIYQKAFDCNRGAQKFILHDGPPYANGHTHIGHAYNKTLKDIVCKSQRMMGKHVPVTPGWDCHGLPIEYAVKKINPELTGAALKKACREYANNWIAVQKSEFKKLGVLMNWNKPYLTMDYSYEAAILDAFGQFINAGYIERKNKTVPWCPSCQTVLASAEIEYYDRKDPSVFVLFQVTPETHQALFANYTDKTVNFLVWTTTPWTLPLNQAVLLKPKTDYVVCDTPLGYIIVAKALIDQVAIKCGFEKNVVTEFNSQDCADNHARAQHPFIENYTVPVIVDESVLLDDGTACVHSAPGVGPIDYEVGVKNGLPIYSPITPDGKYSAEIVPQELVGMSVSDGQGWVITELLNRKKLLFKTSIKHSYPHCWRCRGGLIFRATKQWFCDLSHNSLKEKAIDVIPSLQMIPQGSHNRFQATLQGRLEWCLSRQREWGVPIPALLCIFCDYAYVNQDFIALIAGRVREHGIEYWDSVTVKEIMPQRLSCAQCNGTEFKKETDILDVWFESGVSHYAVLFNNNELAFPADMYLEGKDQHRAWFQSSLLTSLILEKEPCTKAIVTHGFTVDAQGRKMSKSLGNVVSPAQMIEKLGTDGLRLWASSIDNSGDAVVSEVLLKNIQEVLRKIRNTCRFLLSNINDFDSSRDMISVDSLQLIDAYALDELHQIYQEIIAAYQAYDFTRVCHTLASYCAINLSSFYLDIIKDRLYVEKHDGHARRSAQTTCFIILDTITKLMAPILSFTAEQVSDYYQKDKTQSVHLQNFPELTAVWKADEGARRQEWWRYLKDIRSALLKTLEVEREKQVIKHSLEARVTICYAKSPEYSTMMQELFTSNTISEKQQIETEFLKEFLIVSQVVIIKDSSDLEKTAVSGLFAKAERAPGVKCPRCWQWSITANSDDLCSRCAAIV